MSIKSKLERLKEFIKEKGERGVVVAFSGGVDSATLAFICKEVVKDVIAVTVRSEVMPKYELEDAKRIAEEMGLNHHIIDLSLLSYDEFVRNDESRCYFCKKMMICKIKEFAKDRTVFEGANASDLEGHRPGYRAVLEEENVYSPWVEVDITKEEIREIARMLGLPFYNKRSNTCLATRIPYGDRITLDKLRRIDEAERVIREVLGVETVRVRDHGEIARIEVGRDERVLFFDISKMDKIARILKGLGYRYVTMDLEGYREGSLLKR